MKPLFSLCFAVLLSLAAQAQQSRIIFYSENGEMFILEMDKTNKNLQPTYYRRIENLSPTRHDFVLSFPDSKSTSIRRSFTPKPGWEYTFLIRKKLATNNKVMTNFHGQPMSIAGITVWGENQEFDVKQISGIKMQTTDPNAYTSQQSQGADRFTPAGAAPTYAWGNSNTVSYGSAAPSGTQSASSWSVVCSGMMTAGAFETAIAGFNPNQSSGEMKAVAVNIFDNNCLNAAQVRRVVGNFSDDASKMEMAKYGWNHCADRENYFVVFDVFSTEAQVKELSDYMVAHP